MNDQISTDELAVPWAGPGGQIASAGQEPDGTELWAVCCPAAATSTTVSKPAPNSPEGGAGLSGSASAATLPSNSVSRQPGTWLTVDTEGMLQWRTTGRLPPKAIPSST